MSFKRKMSSRATSQAGSPAHANSQSSQLVQRQLTARPVASARRGWRRISTSERSQSPGRAAFGRAAFGQPVLAVVEVHFAQVAVQLTRHQRAHLRGRVEAGAELDGRGDLGDAVDDVVIPVLLYEQPGPGNAALAMVEEMAFAAPSTAPSSASSNTMFGLLPPSSSVSLLQIAGSCGGDDELAHLGGPGERDHVDIRMRRQRRAPYRAHDL